MPVQNHEHRTHFQDCSTSGVVLAATDLSGTPRPLCTGKAKYTIYIRRINVIVTTDAAQAQTFKDTAGTPIVVAVVKASPGIGALTFEFAGDGFALTEGKDLVLSSSPGLAYSYSVEAYIKPSSTMIPSQI